MKGELANDLESTEMARQACDTFNDAIENDGWKLADSDGSDLRGMQAALRFVLGVR